eukprot:7360990-Prymnesium_polylepis.1
MEAVPSQTTAWEILAHVVPQYGPNTILDAGMQNGMKSFISQKHCQSLMDAIWRGGISEQATHPRTHTHTHTHTRTHTHTHARAHTRTRAHAHAHTRTHA